MSPAKAGGNSKAKNNSKAEFNRIGLLLIRTIKNTMQKALDKTIRLKPFLNKL